MKVCNCTLSGTEHCRYCQNNMSYFFEQYSDMPLYVPNKSRKNLKKVKYTYTISTRFE